VRANAVSPVTLIPARAPLISDRQVTCCLLVTCVVLLAAIVPLAMGVPFHSVAVAVLTEPLRVMFTRLGIAIHEICDADPTRLPSSGAAWGRYYEQNPRVCAGLIAPALPKLAGFGSAVTAICA
jgi:hypothetical protein